MSSLHELREMLREHRKQHVPAVSRMKKADVVAELERAKVRHEKHVEKELHVEEEHVENELKKASFPKTVVKKVVATEKKEHTKQVREMKKEGQRSEPLKGGDAKEVASIKHSRMKK